MTTFSTLTIKAAYLSNPLDLDYNSHSFPFEMNFAFASLLIFLTLSSGKSFDISEKTKPFFWNKAETARWLAHSNLWGTLSTTSVHLNGRPWGQPKSFVDGSTTVSTGMTNLSQLNPKLPQL